MTNDLQRISNIDLEQIKKYVDLLDMAMSFNDIQRTAACAVKLRNHADKIINWSATTALDNELQDNTEEGETFDKDDYDWGRE